MTVKKEGSSVYMNQLIDSTAKTEFDTMFNNINRFALENGFKEPKKGDMLTWIIKEQVKGLSLKSAYLSSVLKPTDAEMFSQLIDKDSRKKFNLSFNDLCTYAIEEKLEKPDKGKFLTYLIKSAAKSFKSSLYFLNK